jgi:hypothetical protein
MMTLGEWMIFAAVLLFLTTIAPTVKRQRRIGGKLYR